MSGINGAVLSGLQVKLKTASDMAQTALNNEMVTRKRFDTFIGMGFWGRLRWLLFG